MRITILMAVLALAGPALAGEAYTPVVVQPAQTVEAPADLRADATALLKAVQANDPDAIAQFVAPSVTVVNGFLDIGVARKAKALGKWKNGRAALAELGQNTGGDWDLPPDADIGAFLTDMELNFIEGALTDGQPWGIDPMLPGTICTYGAAAYSAAAAQKVANRLAVEASNFVMVADGTPVLDKPDGKPVGTLGANQLYAADYETDAPAAWMALHLPGGGIGYVAVGEDGLAKPYADGLCFKKLGGGWKIVGQSSTGL